MRRTMMAGLSLLVLLGVGQAVAQEACAPERREALVREFTVRGPPPFVQQASQYVVVPEPVREMISVCHAALEEVDVRPLLLRGEGNIGFWSACAARVHVALESSKSSRAYRHARGMGHALCKVTAQMPRVVPPAPENRPLMLEPPRYRDANL